MKRMTLGQLARSTGLARSSLLHYEALGLLRPAGRSAGGYRLYGEAEIERLQAIRSYREAGLSLAAIGELLEEHPGGTAQLLERQLFGLNAEIARLRAQQKRLATLLAQPELRDSRRPRGKAEWVELLRKAGFDDDDMHRWHAEFEADAPETHAAFLRSLGLSEKEIAKIRRWSTSA
ncbi:MerR family transcriptional regulator [Acidihalobacter prosperus]